MSFNAWAKDTALRAIKTAAQTAVALITANTAGFTDVGWEHVLDVAGLAAVVSILHNLAGVNATPAPVVPEGAAVDGETVDAGAVSVLEICVLFVAVVVLLALVGVVSL